MKRTNKGYSLVELLLTMAIFSIVMIAIVNIMSNASKSYKKGLMEVKVQEEAQIATNQIGDLLVDASSVVTSNNVLDGDGNVTSVTYSFNDSESKPVTLSLEDNKIYLFKDSEKAVLADNVKSFSIDGVKGATTNATLLSDNTCEVNIEIEIDTSNGSNKNVSSYAASREVTFRNQVEYNPSASLLMNNSSDDEKDKKDEEFVGTETVNRGKNINLSCNYDYTKDCILSDGAKDYFDIVISTAFGKTSYSVKIKDAYATPANFSTLNLSDKDCYVYMTDDAGNPINKVKLEVDPVAVTSESGILLLTLDNVNHGGGNTTYIPTKGIDVNEFIHDGGTVRVQTTVTCDGVSKTGDWKTLSYANANDVAYSTSAIGQINIEFNGNKGRWEIGLSGDECSGGMSVVTNNTVYTKEQGNLPNNTTIVFNIEFEKNGSKKQYPIEYKVQFTDQQDISKLQ